MPTFQPEMNDSDALKEFASFVEAMIPADPWIDTLPAASTLLGRLRNSVTDIECSSFYADEVELTDDEAAALVFFAGAWLASADRGPSAAPVRRIASAVSSSELVRRVASREIAPNRLVLVPRQATRVFVIHGRDRSALLELRHWLAEECRLQVVTMEVEKAQGSQTLAEALDEKFAGCGTVVVLATADDIGRLKGGSAQFAARARQNVILELGWAVGLLGRSRVVLLLEESIAGDFPSDWAGVTTLRFQGDVRSIFDGLRMKLQEMGIVSLRPLL